MDVAATRRGLVPIVLACGWLALACQPAAVDGPSGPGGPTDPGEPGQITTGHHVDAARGNDANPGTAEAPWKTWAQAARLAQPGEVVWIHAGTYREHVSVEVSGNETDGPITFQAVPGERVVLTGDASFGSGVALLHVEGQHHLRFAGFTVSGYSTPGTTYAVWIDTGAHHVELDGLTVSGIDASGAGAALPILVIGQDAARPTHDVTVRRSTIADCAVSPGQAITVMGNVDGFTIEDNTVRDIRGIAVDVIGNYGTTIPREPPAGWTYDAVKDRARNGIIRGNTVAAATSTGIYVDGGQDVLVERNTVTGCATGVQVAAEIHAGDGVGRVPSAATVTSTRVTVRDNVVQDIRNGASDAFAFVVGAWTSAYGPVSEVKVTNNTFRSAQGAVRVNERVSGLVFVNNVVATDTSSPLLNDLSGVTASNRFDHNLWYCAGTPRFSVAGTYYGSLPDMAAGTGREAGSLYAVPGFVDGAAGDLRLAATSPAVGKGDPGVVAGGETDRAGRPRVTAGKVDIGAYQR